MGADANGYGSIKILLKQVYAVHSAKVKSLEDEIDQLKLNLQEAENKLKKNDTECKRCIELETAFNSCKAALYEQSKLFESLGQRFSTSYISENKTSGEKDIKDNNDAVNCEESINTQVAPVKKVDLSSNPKWHFLKNIMSLNSSDDYQESLELSTAPFEKNNYQEYSTLNPDSLVLAPNTVDLVNDIQIKTSKEKSELCKVKNIDIPSVNISADAKRQVLNKKEQNCIKKNNCKGKSKKRSSDSIISENSPEKCHKEKELKSVNKKIKSITAVENDTFLPTMSSKTNENISPKNKKSKIDTESININTKKNNTPALDIIIQKATADISDDNMCKKMIAVNQNDNDVSNDDFQVTVSPSLLPLNEKTNNKALTELSPVMEDISDFMPTVSKKNLTEEGTWTSCNKKKIAKKTLALKPFKSTSKFKIHLDSLPPDYKKPTYRQTKLSKSIFQPKSSTPKQKSDIDDTNMEEKSSEFEINLPSTSGGLLATSGNNKTVDFDATCIPENYAYKTATPKEICEKSKNSDFENSVMIVKYSTDDSDEESSPEMIIEQPILNKNKTGKTDLKNLKSQELKNSFDRLPRRPEPDYKYKEETVRKKSERKQLTAFDCKECEKYYSELGLSEDEKQKRMHKCSRHRAKFAPPPTPEHFWELEFPDTQECKARGYLNETQKAKLKTRRKRPL